MELDPQVSPEEIMSMEVELGCESWTSFASGCLLNSGATDIVFETLPSTAVETAAAQCTSRCAMARGRSLNTSIVLAAVHGLSGLFRAVSAVEPSLSRPPPLFFFVQSVFELVRSCFIKHVRKKDTEIVCFFFFQNSCY